MEPAHASSSFDQAESEKDYERQHLIKKQKRVVESEDDSSGEEDYSDEDDSTTDPSGRGTATTVKESFFVTCLNLIKVTIGGCLPYLPHAWKGLGWSALILLFCTLVVSAYSAILLGRLQTLKARILFSYRDIAGRALSKELSFVVLLIMLIQIYLSLCLNLTVISQAFRHFDTSLSIEFSFLICCLVIIGFLILTNLVDVGLIGAFSNLIPYGFPLYMFAANFISSVDQPDNSEYDFFTEAAPIPGNFGVFLFCLSSHYTYPTIKGKMQDPDRWESAIIVSFSIIFCVYAFTGVVSYLAFGQDVMYCALLNFTDDTGAKVLLIMIIIQGLLSLAETLNPFARVIEVYIGINRFSLPTKYLSSFIFRILLVAIAYGIGYSMREMYGTVTALLGVTFCCFTTILFPVLCYIYSHWRSSIPFLERLWLIFILLGSATLILWNLVNNLPVLFGIDEDGSPDY